MSDRSVQVVSEIAPEPIRLTDAENQQQRTVTDKQAVQWGMQLQRQGHLSQAESIYRQVLGQQPRHSDALHLLGLLMHQRGRNELAIDLLRRAIDTRPSFAAYRSNLGVILRAAGDQPAALRAHAEAVRLAPDSAEMHNNLCVIHDDLADTEQALRHGFIAIALAPDYPEARNNVANVLRRSGRLYEAIMQLREALKLRPGFPDAWFSLALALEQLGDFDQALKSYDKVLVLSPEHWNARANRALVHLLLGDFAVGFPEYERCSQRLNRSRRKLDSPVWGGQPIAGLTLLISMEPDLRDAIMFSRYASLLAKVSGARLIAECDPSLRELFACVASVEQWVDHHADAPAHDFHVRWFSLPRLLKTTVQSIPSPHAYLRPPPALINDPDLRMPKDLAAGRSVGVVWSVNAPARAQDQCSCPFSYFLQLLQVPAVALINLQNGQAANDWMPVCAPTRMLDMGSRCRNLAETATVLAQLDLVVTVDCAVAHLAAALGKPVWLLLPKIADWRWQLKREDSPWYPSIRLFRQEHAGDWGGVFARVLAALATR